MEILIDIDTVRNKANQLKNYRKNLDENIEYLKSIKEQLDYEVKCRRNIVDSINNLKTRILIVEDRIEKIEYLLLLAADNYESAEKTVVKLLQVLEENLLATGIEVFDSHTCNKYKKSIKKIISLIRKNGIVGTTVGSVVVGAQIGLVTGIINKIDIIKTKIGGIPIWGKCSMNLFGSNAEVSASADANEDKSAGLCAKGEVSGYIAQGKVEYKKGIASSTSKVTVGSATGSCEARSVLFKDGKFNPKAEINAGVDVNVITGNIENKIGSEKNNIHSSMTGTIGSGEAKAGCEFGENGVGAKAEVGAAVFKGEVKNGFTLLGVNVDLSIGGEAIAVGAKAEAGIMESTNESGEEVTTLDVAAKVSALVGLGLNLKISWVEEII